EDFMPTLHSIGQRLAFARDRAGLTQAQAAAAIRKSRTVLHGLETGKRPVKDAYVALLAELYGCSADWLRTGEVDPPVGRSPVGAPRPVPAAPARVVAPWPVPGLLGTALFLRGVF